ncbi:hypothetical protein JCM19233_1758 [Vibrio astriarenae]|nr:hypothetical protein JCM19233_1758 [Vibrio sp. C7]
MIMVLDLKHKILASHHFSAFKCRVSNEKSVANTGAFATLRQCVISM